MVSYNKLPYTRLCLERMLQSEPLPTQIIVVDNGSTDGSHQYLSRDFWQQARTSQVEYVLIANESNVGACTARNQALEIAQGKYLSFGDNDLATGSRNWLAILAARLEGGSRVGIAGPKLLFPFPPHDIECAGVAISPSGRVQYRGRGQPQEAFSRAEPVPGLISACWLMKREVYEQIGPLDEVFNPAQYEDLDFCYRAREAGWEVWYEPAAVMYHYENVTTAGSSDINFRYVTIRNGLEFKRRWQHMFRREGGPPDEECRWQDLPPPSLEETDPPPLQ